MQDGYISLRAFGRAHDVRLSAVQKAIKTNRVTDVLRNDRGFVVGIHAVNAWIEWQRNTDLGEAAKSGKVYAGVDQHGSAPSVADSHQTSTPASSGASSDDKQRLNASVAVSGVLAEPPSQEGDIPPRAADSVVVHKGTGVGRTEAGQLPLTGQLSGTSSQEDASPPAAPVPGFMEHKTEREKHLAALAELEYLERVGAVVSAEDVERQVEEIFAVVKSNAFRIIPKKSAILAAETDPGRIERLLTEALTQAFHESSRAFADVAAGGVEERATAMP
ncbi:MAG TPA: hypothetical protein VJT81_06680 [Burkholderiales bacterium]|nr:hypothetical protein [Burkholderiales bacterium]